MRKGRKSLQINPHYHLMNNAGYSSLVHGYIIGKPYIFKPQKRAIFYQLGIGSYPYSQGGAYPGDVRIRVSRVQLLYYSQGTKSCYSKKAELCKFIEEAITIGPLKVNIQREVLIGPLLFIEHDNYKAFISVIAHK